MIVNRALVAEALPGYELGEELGRGAFGLVLAARHRQLGRQVAVKVLTASGGPPGQLERQFLAEARVLSELDHPHIVRLHDYVEHRGCCLLVMERLAGGSLGNRGLVKAGLEYACGVGLAVADALQAAHRRHVLHRDIKPDNLLIAADGTVKVTDFGIAKLFEGTAVKATSFIGSPTYMAPEQATLGRIGPGTDLYSLNVVLYQLLTGRPLFPRDLPPAAMILQHLNHRPPPMTEVPDEIAEVILRALAKKIGDRPRSARAYGLELAHAAARSLGADWLSRAHLPIRIDEELRDAARSLRPSTQVTARRPVFRPAVAPPVESPPLSFIADPIVPVSGGSDWTGPVVVPATPAWLMASGPQPKRLTGRRRLVAAGVAGLVAVASSVAVGFSVHGFNQPVVATGPGAVAVVGDTLYVTDPDHNQIRRLSVKDAGSSRGTVVAGTGKPGFSGDGGKAVNARLDDPGALAVDQAGNLYIADQGNHRVRKVAVNGTIATVAGGGARPAGGAIKASQAKLTTPFSIAVSGPGTVWIAEPDRNQVSKVTTDGRIEVVAGTGQVGFSGDGKAAKLARLNGPDAVAVTSDEQSLYIGDQGNGRVRSVNLRSGIILTYAGNGSDDKPLNDRMADAVSLQGVYSLAVDSDGSLYVGGENLRKVALGSISGIATPVTKSVAVGSGGSLYLVADDHDTFGDPVRRLYSLANDGTLTRLAF